MTAVGERFAQMPEAMVKDRTLHHSAFRVYSSIYLHANWDGSWTHISEDVIAEDLGLTRAAIAMQIRILVERGYLKILRRQGCRNQYRICPDPSVQLTPSFKERVKPVDGLEDGPVKPLDDTRQFSLQDPSILFTGPVKPLDTVPDSYPDVYPDSFPEGDVETAPPPEKKKPVKSAKPEVSPPPELARFDAILRDLKGYQPDAHFYAWVIEACSGLDLPAEALKARAHAQKKNYSGNMKFVMDWLGRAIKPPAWLREQEQGSGTARLSVVGRDSGADGLRDDLDGLWGGSAVPEVAGGYGSAPSCGRAGTGAGRDRALSAV